MLEAQFTTTKAEAISVFVPSMNLTVTSRTPVLSLCRRLVEIGIPDQPLKVTRNGKPVLRVHSIYRASKLTVIETNLGPKFAPFKAFDVGRIRLAA